MIKADVSIQDLACQATWEDGAIRIGRSRIRPFQHAALETRLVRTEGQWFAVVRERSARTGRGNTAPCEDVDATRFDELYREALLWPLDYLLVEVAQAGCRIKLRAGILGAAPVYCRVTEDRIVVSYDFADFLAQPSTIDLQIASRRLALHADYSARQICSGVLMLTERSMLYAEPGRTHFQYPTPAEAHAPQVLIPDDQVLTTFQELLHQAVSARPATADRIAVELSGGMDSATTACALSSAHGKVASLGILLDDEHRDAQAERRQAIVDRLGLHDQTLDIQSFAPTLDLQPSPARREYPLAEFYLEAFEALWDRARTDGRELLFTGLGGDQLFPIYRNESQPATSRGLAVVAEAKRRAEALLTPRALHAAQSLHGLDAPAGLLPASVLASSMCQSPHLLRRGLWPVNPLSDPHLVAFCYGLPLRERQDRETMRRFLHARLGENVFPRQYAKETFAHVLPKLIAQQAKKIASQLRDCALADLGLVDRKAVLALLDELAATRARPLTAPLASFLWLERFVRQVA